MRLLHAVVALGIGCVHTDTRTCGDAVCPAGTSCTTVTTEVGTSQTRCALPAQVAACEAKSNGDACTLAATTNATCNGGACFADICGDGLRGLSEACDDTNDTSGDGCSSDCRSTEVCGNAIVDPQQIVNGVSQLDESCDDGNARSHDGCVLCSSEDPRWTEIRFDRPGARVFHGMAFDTRRHELLLFGGDDGGASIPSEIWVWDGRDWRARRSDIEPPGRVAGRVAYDSARDRLVVFGGTESSFSVPLADLWEWDGARWEEKIGAMGPGPRFDHAVVFDSVRQETLVIGGTSVATVSGDTWRWNGTWRRFDPPTSADALPPRTRAAAAFDPVRGETVLFGGADETTATYAETYLFDGTRWRRGLGTQPPARLGAAMAWDPTSRRVILFGGITVGGPLADAWAWDGQTWTALPGGPSARSDASMASDFERGGVVLYGGLGALPRSDTWWFDGSAWHDRTPTYTPSLLDVGAAMISSADTILVFGGRNSSNTPVATTQISVRGVWSQLPAGPSDPSARLLPSMIYMPSIDSVVMWGGSPNTGDGTWGWNGTWRRLVPPATSLPLRLREAVAFDEARGEIVVFGGFQGSITLGETWIFDGTAWTRRFPTNSPPPRFNAAMAYDPIRKRVVLVGGQNAAAPLADLWTWDGTSWTEIPQTIRPPARANAHLSWTPSRERLLLAGGNDVNGALVRDVWELDDTTWNRLDIPPPPAPLSSVMIGTTSGKLRLSNRNNDPFNAEVWRLRWESSVPDEVCASADDIDGDGLVGCADPDCDTACSECGNGTCRPLESCHLCPADCGSCVERCGDAVCSQGETPVSCPGDC